MKVREARAVASRWVAAHAGAIPGFAGAFLSGSTIWLPAGEELPATSDVDLLVVAADHPPPPKLGELPYGGLLVEVSFLSWEQLDSSEQVLGSCYLAGSFRTDTVLADPSGRLARLREAVAGEWAARAWVRRCRDAERRILDGLARLDPGQPAHDQVTTWLSATSLTTEVLLTAGLATRASASATLPPASCSTRTAGRSSVRRSSTSSAAPPSPGPRSSGAWGR